VQVDPEEVAAKAAAADQVLWLAQHLVDSHGEDPGEVEVTSPAGLHGMHDGDHDTTWATSRIRDSDGQHQHAFVLTPVVRGSS